MLELFKLDLTVNPPNGEGKVGNSAVRFVYIGMAMTKIAGTIAGILIAGCVAMPAIEQYYPVALDRFDQAYNYLFKHPQQPVPVVASKPPEQIASVPVKAIPEVIQPSAPAAVIPKVAPQVDLTHTAPIIVLNPCTDVIPPDGFKTIVEKGKCVFVNPCAGVVPPNGFKSNVEKGKCVFVAVPVVELDTPRHNRVDPKSSCHFSNKIAAHNACVSAGGLFEDETRGKGTWHCSVKICGKDDNFNPHQPSNIMEGNEWRGFSDPEKATRCTSPRHLKEIGDCDPVYMRDSHICRRKLACVE